MKAIYVDFKLFSFKSDDLLSEIELGVLGELERRNPQSVNLQWLGNAFHALGCSHPDTEFAGQSKSFKPGLVLHQQW